MDAVTRPGMRFGAHVRTGGTLAAAPHRARAIGAECFQVFVGNPRGWRATVPTDAQIAGFRAACAETGIEPYVHAMYLVNYGTTDEALLERSVAALCHTMRVADELGVAGVVTHLGSHKRPGDRAGGLDDALDRLCEGLAAGLAATGTTTLLAENSAGAGGTIGNTVEELSRIVSRLGAPARFGVCLDTAHLFAAGYEIRTRDGLDAMFGEFDAEIGLDRLRLLHLNDSKTGLGSRVDRHENIGDGHIGTDGFARLVNHPAVAGRPGILEVPGLSGQGPDAANLERLKAMLAP